MENIFEKVAYLKGLAEGLDLKENEKYGKLMLGIIEGLETISNNVEELSYDLEDLEEYVEYLDEDLGDLEDEVFDIDECNECDDYDDYDEYDIETFADEEDEKEAE